jgi:iron(III) transport system substrate-binding protein
MKRQVIRDLLPALLIAAAMLLSPAATMAQSASPKPTTPAEIALYSGPDRQSMLEACAKAEGEVSLIAGVFGDTVIGPLVKVFNQRYPGIKVSGVRMDEPQMVARVTQEARAGRHAFDVLDNGPASFFLLRKLGLLDPFYTPLRSRYAKEQVDPDGYYVAVRTSAAGPVYNTKLLRAELVPKTWDDLLNPALKGKMVIASDNVIARIMTGMIQMRGRAEAEKYFAALSKQDIKVYRISSRALVDLIAGGEAPMAISALPIHAEAAKQKKAPVEWARMDVLVAWANAIARAKDAPHPCAGALWTDFMLDPQLGQVGLSNVGYLPASAETKSQYAEINATRFEYIDQVWESEHAEELQTLKEKYFVK